MAVSKNSNRSRTSKRARPTKAAAPRRLALFLVALSSLAVLYFWKRGYLLWFGDATAHLNIARRLFDGRHPGYEQIGTVWLPLPHVLMAPLALVDGMWRSGLAGSFPSALGFVSAVLLLYGAARRTYGCEHAALAAALLFALNPNMLYLQSIPMTEGIYALSLMLTLYGTVKGSGLLTGVGLLAGSMTRYETWFLMPFAVGYLFWRDRKAGLIAGTIAALGPLYWLLHNWVFHGDALDFYWGVGSAKWIFEQGQARATEPSRTAGNPLAAMQYYARAGRLFVGLPLAIAAGLGLAGVFKGRAWWPVFFLVLGPAFFVWSMQGSGGEIHVPGLWPDAYYNTRYAMAVLPLGAFCAAGLVALAPGAWKRGAIAGVVFAAMCPWIFYPREQNWVTWKESEVNSVSRRAWTREAAEYLGPKYEEGTGIVAHFGDLTGIFQQAGIPLRETVHDGDGLYFLAIGKRPDLFLWQEWVITIQGDSLSEAMAGLRQKRAPYARVKIVEVPGAAPVEIWRRSPR